MLCSGAAGAVGGGIGSWLTPSQQTAILNNPIMKYIGDHPDIGWYLRVGGATLLTGGLAGDVCAVESGTLFGTRYAGNTPLLSNWDFLRVGWSYIRYTGEYTFRIGGGTYRKNQGRPPCNFMAS
jgi:hypothetical protein